MANGTQYSHETFTADMALLVDLRFRQISLGSSGGGGEGGAVEEEKVGGG